MSPRKDDRYQSVQALLSACNKIDATDEDPTVVSDKKEAVVVYETPASKPEETLPKSKSTKPRKVGKWLCVIGAAVAVFFAVYLLYQEKVFSSPEELYELGKKYYESKDYEKAVYWYQKAAEQGNAGAQNNLGVCYYNGEGVTQDYSKAVYWFQKAAEQGNANAQYSLGNSYHFGEGVTQDDSKAKYWWNKAAEQGHEGAKKRLGDI